MNVLFLRRIAAPAGHFVPLAAVAGMLAVASVAAPAPAALAGGPAQPEPCSVAVDKRAAPPRIPLGDEVTVTLDVSGTCPERVETAEVLLVIDASLSMGWEGKIEAAKQAAVTFVGLTDPALVRVGLISFYAVAVLEQPLTSDHAAIERAILGLTLDYGTNLVDPLEMARQELSAAGLRPGAKRVVIFLTDGRHRVSAPPVSDLDGVIAGLQAAGIETFTIGLGTDADQDLLRRVASSSTHFFYSPTPQDLEDILGRIAGIVRAQVLLETARITDIVPANMIYIAGSGQPLEPTVSPDGKTLVWNFVRVREQGQTVSYRLRPQEVGVWPTNVRADLAYVDGFGTAGSAVFPVPEVEVYDDQVEQGLCVCRVVRQRVPAEVIERILADPASTYGWQYPLDPGKPGSPANPPRLCLTLRNFSIDYHPIFNPPVWRKGCP